MNTYTARFYVPEALGDAYFDVHVQATSIVDAQLIMESMHGYNHSGLSTCD